MNPLRPRLRGLVFKLTVFYVLLSVPCLVVMETGLLTLEFRHLMAEVEAGALTRAAESAAKELASRWREAPSKTHLDLWAEALGLRLQRPTGGLLAQRSFVLSELSSTPIAVAILNPQGEVLATAPAGLHWQPPLPDPGSADWRARTGLAGQLWRVADGPWRVRRALAPVSFDDGRVHGYLLVELRLPVPWRRFLLDASLEWPIVLGYLIVFAVASSLFLAAWVTRRLNRVARAARAWRRGDFSDRINDSARDELGELSALLDAMALDLKDLMRSRTRLATLAERQRLARDLHDTVKQQAFALNLQLAAVRRSLEAHPSAARLAQAERLSQQIQQELAELLDELSTSSEASLPSRLRERASEWAQASGLALELDLTEPLEVEEPHALSLLRITDEALANVLRHSGATAVRLRLAQVGETIELTIVDNGRGARQDDRPGMGLANMRERALTLPGGTFEFASAPASGTRVCVRFSTRTTVTATA
jgi:signal transduction histidine kinase